MFTVIGWIVCPIISILLGWIVASITRFAKEITALKLGLQALLRDRLIQLYNHYESIGYVDIDVRDNFLNMYKQYHSLGENGVIDDIKEKFLNLPTSKPKNDE